MADTNKPSSLPNIKKNFLLSMMYEVLCIITPFITAPYASRILGASNIGIYSYTNSIVMYFSLFAVLGTAQYGQREIARTRDNKELNSKLFWEIELLSIFTSLITLIFWFIFVIFQTEYRIYYIILTLSILAKMFDISWFYKGLEEFKYTVGRNFCVRLFGIVCLFLFVKSPKDLWIYFLFHTAFDFLGNITMWITIPKFLNRISIKELKILPHFKSTLTYFVPAIATSIYTVLDKTLLGLITKDTIENGYYEQATKLVNIVKTLCFSSLNSIMGSRISYLFEQNAIDEIKNKITLSLNFILFMSIGSTFGLIGIARNFVPLFYGQGYEPVIQILQLLSFILIITGISTCLTYMYYVPGGLRKLNNKFVIIGAIVNFILNIILIPKLTSIGAVIATLIAEGIIAILLIVYSNKFVTFKKLFFISIKKLVAGITMMFILYTLSLLKLSPFYLLVSQLITGVITYICILLLLKDSIVIIVYDKIKNKISKTK